MVKNVIIGALLLAVAGLVYFISAENAIAPITPGGPKTETPIDEVMCAQVITPALNPETGEIVEFPTPCDVPEGWELIENEIPTLDLEVN